MTEKRSWLTMERLFLLVYIPLVVTMMVVMPIGAPPDEPVHLGREWLLSTGQIGTEKGIYPANLLEALNTPVNGTEDAARLNEKIRGARLSEETATAADNEATGIYPAAAYVPQSLTMLLTRLFTDRIDLICRGARIGSMIVTGLLFFFTIRRTPAGKGILLAIGVLPLTLQEAASASCDGMAIAGICWITAELLRRVCGTEEKTPASMLRSAGIGAGALLFKIFYSPVLLLSLMTGEAKGRRQRRRNNLVMAGVFLSAAAIWYLFSVQSRTWQGGLTAGAMNRLGQVAANPLILIGAQVRTVIARTPGWIRQLFGVFGRLDVFSPWILTALTGVSFLAVAVMDSGIGAVLTKKRARRFRILMICAFILCWTLLSAALLVWWTPEDDPLIEGLQGRYFLPAMFGMLLCLPEVTKINPERREIIRRTALGIFIACSAASVILLGIRL
ncbi:MAG: DUF2142 domain-containing protein [Clostridia bacterium]|nr:DUF2142 domain-containing protein [Clostridia bacterium]